MKFTKENITHLISLSDYIFIQEKIRAFDWDNLNLEQKCARNLVFADTTYNYRCFLRQPLKLWMFVPCNDDREVLVKPEPLAIGTQENFDKYEQNRCAYQKAKEKVLFEGFTYSSEEHTLIYEDCLIELEYVNARGLFMEVFEKECCLISDLLNIWSSEPQLTNTALKKAGL